MQRQDSLFQNIPKGSGAHPGFYLMQPGVKRLVG